MSALLAQALRIDVGRVKLRFTATLKNRQVTLRDFSARIDGKAVSDAEAEALAAWCASAARARGGDMQEVA